MVKIKNKIMLVLLTIVMLVGVCSGNAFHTKNKVDAADFSGSSSATFYTKGNGSEFEEVTIEHYDLGLASIVVDPEPIVVDPEPLPQDFSWYESFDSSYVINLDGNKFYANGELACTAPSAVNGYRFVGWRAASVVGSCDLIVVDGDPFYCYDCSYDFFEFYAVYEPDIDVRLADNMDFNRLALSTYTPTGSNDTLAQAITSTSENVETLYDGIFDLTTQFILTNQDVTFCIETDKSDLTKDDIYVMHYTNNQWQRETVSDISYANGELSITAHFDSFSPVAILCSSNGGDAETGVETNLMILGICAMSGLAMLVNYLVSRKKIRVK